MATEVRAEYLVVGGGAMGMAFTDVLMAETDATMMVSRRSNSALVADKRICSM